jgi:hypothetical protein
MYFVPVMKCGQNIDSPKAFFFYFIQSREANA